MSTKPKKNPKTGLAKPQAEGAVRVRLLLQQIPTFPPGAFVSCLALAAVGFRLCKLRSEAGF